MAQQNDRNEFMNDIGQINLTYEQTQAYTKQSLQGRLQEQKYQCFQQSQSGQEYAKCCLTNVKQLEQLGKETRFRLVFFEKKMEECFRKGASDEYKQLKECSGELRQLAQQICASITPTQQKK